MQHLRQPNAQNGIRIGCSTHRRRRQLHHKGGDRSTPPPSIQPPLDHQLAQAKKQQRKQAEQEIGLQLALRYLGPETFEELQDSIHIPT